MKKIIVGLLFGALAVMALPTMAQGKRGGDKKAELQKMVTELGLDETQTTKLKTILREQKGAIKEDRISKEEMAKLSKADQKVEKAKMRLKRVEAEKVIEEKLQTVLTAEQMQKFKAMQKQKVEQRKVMQKEQMERKPENMDMHQTEPIQGNG